MTSDVPHPIYAAITGDVVRSARLTPAARERVMTALRDGAQAIKAVCPGGLVGGVHLYRGDGMQFLLCEPAHALRATLAFLASVKAATGPRPVDLRLMLGIGTVSTLPEVTGAGGDGEAYRLSGRGLEAMRVQQRLGLAVDARFVDGQMVRLLDALTQTVGALSSGWTARQAFLVLEAMQGLTQRQIGRLPEVGGVSQQAVAKVLASARWAAVEQALVAFEGALGLKQHY